jgi:hypothetical protein
VKGLLSRPYNATSESIVVCALTVIFWKGNEKTKRFLTER